MDSTSPLSDIISPESTVTTLLASSGHFRSSLRSPGFNTTFRYRDKVDSASSVMSYSNTIKKSKHFHNIIQPFVTTLMKMWTICRPWTRCLWPFWQFVESKRTAIKITMNNTGDIIRNSRVKRFHDCCNCDKALYRTLNITHNIKPDVYSTLYKLNWLGVTFQLVISKGIRFSLCGVGCLHRRLWQKAKRRVTGKSGSATESVVHPEKTANELTQKQMRWVNTVSSARFWSICWDKVIRTRGHSGPRKPSWDILGRPRFAVRRAATFLSGVVRMYFRSSFRNPFQD